jgi:uncharacterized protein (TIGR03663 family)
VSIRSIRSRRSSAAPRSAPPRLTAEPTESRETGSSLEGQLSPVAWRTWSLLILVVGTFLRLWQLGLKPLHHDEGVNGLFLVRLIREGEYRYDPANYHGPTLYYFGLALARIKHFFGGALDLDVAGLRTTPALFAIATIWLVLQLRRWTGDRPAILAAGLIAVSPCAVYFARDFIHESLLVFFTVACVASMLHYAESRRRLYLFLAATSAALVFATKETAVISVGVLLFARTGSFLWIRMRGRQALRTASISASVPPWLDLAASLTLLVFLLILFFSSFLSKMDAVRDSVVTFRMWGHTGLVLNRHPWHSYLLWLAESELAILLLGSLGLIISLWQARRTFAVFLAFWALGTIAVYSLLPYKTPWLTLNIVVPLGILAGLGLDFILVNAEKAFGRSSAFIISALILLTATLPIYQCVSLNWFRYDDDSHPYVYSQTPRCFLALVSDINEAAKRFGTGDATSMTVTSSEYWPLPWYLRDYAKAGYYGHVVTPHEQIVVASRSQEAMLWPLLNSDYVRVATYPLRPGVDLVCYFRQQSPVRPAPSSGVVLLRDIPGFLEISLTNAH